MFTVGAEEFFVSERSAFCTGQMTGVVVPEVLLPVFGSVSGPEMVAVFVAT